MKTLRFTIVLALLCVLLAACGATVGTAARSSVSKFDNSRDVWIAPHGANCGMTMVCTMIGAEWNSAHPHDAALQVQVFGAYTAIRAAEVRIDGQTYVLQPDHDTTHFSNPMLNSGNPGLATTTEQSDRYYATTLGFVRRMATATDVRLRVVTGDGTIDSIITSADADSKAHHALQRFLAKVDGAPGNR